MASLLLTQTLVDNAKCVPTKNKSDYFDSKVKGLLLKVLKSDTRTFYIRYRNAWGAPVEFKLGNASILKLSDARQLAKKHLSDVLMGNDPSEAKAQQKLAPTIETLIKEHYLPHVKTTKRSWKTDESLLRNHILPQIGSKHVDEITRADIIAIHHGRLNSGAAKGSANRLLILLRYIFNLALRWEIPGITKNPAAGVPLFEDPPTKERFLTPGETRALIEAIRNSDNPMLQYIVPMLLLTGARKREVLDACWTDFDLDRKQWRIPTTKAGKPRYVPLSDSVLQLLASIPHTDCPWVFANPKTQKPYVTIFCSWNTARKAAGLADVRIHDLRHSFASFLVNSGRTLYEVQKILGHTQVKTTQRYAHLSQETLVDAANSAAAATGLDFLVAPKTPIPGTAISHR